jgi:oxygen-independent coproporphyrinogen-3 oxidase
MNTQATLQQPGLYIHVPFCTGKCPYCDFFSTLDLSLGPAWLAALERELSLQADFAPCFDTLYLGGGTPSALRAADLERLVELIGRHAAFSDKAERTIEANPNDLTAEKTALLFELGFNRISLGVQSFDDRDLRRLNRRHTAADNRRAIDLIRAAGFTNLSIDLMYGVPDQTRQGWEQTLQQALDCAPAHLSCYQLTVKEGTRFWVLQQEGRLGLPGEQELCTLFLATDEMLTGAGYIHYEVSNFARSQPYFAAHNRRYWQHAPYLGLGPAAHSFMPGRRWWNCRSVTQYIALLDRGFLPIEGEETITAEQAELERLLLHFRTTEGIPLALLQGSQDAGATLERLQREKFIEVVDDKAVPTTKGLLVADSLPGLFL